LALLADNETARVCVMAHLTTTRKIIMINRIMALIGFSTASLSPTAAEQVNLRARMGYLGGSIDSTLQERLRLDKDQAEERREAPKKRQTLLEGLAVSLMPHKRDTGEQPQRNRWGKQRRR
jgi:hypothetical protein